VRRVRPSLSTHLAAEVEATEARRQVPDAMRVDYARALRRAELKRQVASILDQLVIADRRAVLFDLIAESARRVGTTLVRTRNPGQVRSTTETKPPVRAGSLPTRAPAVAISTGRSSAILAALKKQRRMSVGDLAAIVYGDPGPNSAGKTRSLLHSLKKRSKVKPLGAGRWTIA
jgi:hypothetical protein